MKNAIYLFGFISLLIVSCTNDNDIITPLSSDSNVLLQQKIEIVNGESSTSNFDYLGFKINNQTDPVKSFTYEYVGDLISKITFQAFDDINHKKEQLLQYDNINRLSQVIELYHYGPNAPLGYKNVYTHNNDNTISFNQFKGDLIMQEIPNGSGKYFLNENGEVDKFEQYNTNGDLSISVNFFYDTKNAPMKNVKGFDKLFFVNEGKNHNITSLTINSEGSPEIQAVYTFEYNSDDFPENQTITHISENDIIINKSIQYVYN